MSETPQFVKAAQPHHAGQIADLQIDALQCFFQRVGVNQPVVREEIERVWEAAITGAGQGRFVLVAEDDGEFVGFVAVDNSEILALEVLPAAQGRGHGSRLLAAVADIIGTGVLSMWLFPEQEAHLRLLQGAGFGPAGQRRQFAGPTSPLFQHLWHAELV